jgi:hypothetical protein
VLTRYLVALCLTLIVEVPLVLLILRRLPWRRVLVVALAANLATHLAIHFVLPRAHLGPVAFELTAEVLALAVEATVYAVALRPPSVWLAMAASAAANGASYLLGLLVMR